MCSSPLKTTSGMYLNEGPGTLTTICSCSFHGRQNWDSIFRFVDFLVQIRKIPHYAYSEPVALRLWHSLTQCVQIQIRSCDTTHEKFFHLHIIVDMEQLFRQVLRIACAVDEEYWGLMRYERLSWFCFNCGLIGHQLQDCPGPSLQELVPTCSSPV